VGHVRGAEDCSVGHEFEVPVDPKVIYA
jgi:hypothetical protein